MYEFCYNYIFVCVAKEMLELCLHLYEPFYDIISLVPRPLSAQRATLKLRVAWGQGYDIISTTARSWLSGRGYANYAMGGDLMLRGQAHSDCG